MFAMVVGYYVVCSMFYPVKKHSPDEQLYATPKSLLYTWEVCTGCFGLCVLVHVVADGVPVVDVITTGSTLPGRDHSATPGSLLSSVWYADCYGPPGVCDVAG